MKQLAASPGDFMNRHPRLVYARLDRVRGSSPREEGAFMLISEVDNWGTIGGGQLEQMVIDAAREMLAGTEQRKMLDIPLGPEISQCCGGRVEVELVQPSRQEREQIVAAHLAEVKGRPHVYVFGAGHTGRAICNLLQFMPLNTVLVDERIGEQDKCWAQVARNYSVLPEGLIRQAPQGSAAIVLTHSHSQDFILAQEALSSGRFSYVGMIGSKTKRAQFMSWFHESGTQGRAEDLVCPIGANSSSDKRPEAIAAFVVAEIMACLSAASSAGDLTTSTPAEFVRSA